MGLNTMILNLCNGNVLLVTNDRKPKNTAIQAGRDTNLITGTNIRSLTIIEVKTLVNKIMEPGFKNITWDSQDDNGSLVSSGIYFIVCTQDKKILPKR